MHLCVRVLFFQRNSDSSSVDFGQKTFAEYKEGFGDPSGDHFIGLEHMHALTGSASYALITDVQTTSGPIETIMKECSISGESEKYTLS